MTKLLLHFRHTKKKKEIKIDDFGKLGDPLKHEERKSQESEFKLMPVLIKIKSSADGFGSAHQCNGSQPYLALGSYLGIILLYAHIKKHVFLFFK